MYDEIYYCLPQKSSYCSATELTLCKLLQISTPLEGTVPILFPETKPASSMPERNHVGTVAIRWIVLFQKTAYLL
jgi:hypothetical protein